MKYQLQGGIEMFELRETEKVNEIVTSSAQRHLQGTNGKCEKLMSEKNGVFHLVVANSYRSRRGLGQI